jgi:hypothetical protein
MTSQERDPRIAQELMDEPDFAAEHDKATFADEHVDRPGMEPDESTPSDRTGAGGLDQQTPVE